MSATCTQQSEVVKRNVGGRGRQASNNAISCVLWLRAHDQSSPLITKGSSLISSTFTKVVVAVVDRRPVMDERLSIGKILVSFAVYMLHYVRLPTSLTQTVVFTCTV